MYKVVRYVSVFIAMLIGALVVSTVVPAGAQQRTYSDQPNMNAAQQALRQAEAALQRATTDKGGHRTRAIELIREAEREVQSGIEYDSRMGLPGGQSGAWRGHLPPDDQQRFDSYYSRWLEYRRTNDADEVASMQERMRDLMSRNNIPANVPFDQIASGGATFQTRWRQQLSADKQKKFDSYYSRWLEYRRTSNVDQIASMEARMRELMSHNKIPMTVSFEEIASPTIGH